MSKRIRILHLEDEPADAILIQHELKKSGLNHEVLLVDNEADFIAKLDEKVDLVISDYQLPQYDALRALQQLKTTGFDIPFIICTGTMGEDIVADVMKQGAADYLLKDRLMRLGQAVNQALEQRRLRRSKQRSEEAMGFLADASAVLSSSLNVQKTLAAFAELLVPKMADCCLIHLVNAKGALVEVASASSDPTKIVRDQEFNSSICVTLTARELKLGTLTLIRSESGREYDEEDALLAEELARRASLATDNAMLYGEAQEAIRHQEQLYEEAQRANILKDEFLATVSHELRTPLTAIIGWTELLRNQEISSDEYHHAFEVLYRNARSQLQIIDDLLDVSRIISGKLELDLGTVRIDQLVQGALDSIELAAKAKSITTEISIEGRGAEVQGDPGRLQQVLWNLLTNAIKFTPMGGKIEVSVRFAAAKVEIAIKDSGQGIDTHFLPYVFDRFRQEDGSKTRRQGGLGLGLSIVRHIVELHGGEVEARSEGKGNGASFIIRIPALSPNQVTPDGPGQIPGFGKPDLSQMTTASRSVLASVKVLVIDDEEDSRSMAQAFLERYGATVIPVSTAYQGMNELEKSQLDVILCDIGMPDMDGYMFIKNLRQLEKQRGGYIPVAALTAFASIEDRREALASGFDEHLSKPMQGERLVEAVEKLCKLGSRKSIDPRLLDTEGGG